MADNTGTSTSIPNPFNSMVYFLIITTIYFILRYKYLDVNIDTVSNKTKKNVWFAIYLLLIIIGQYGINVSLTQSMCSSYQWKTALFTTLIPWIFIFGVLHIILKTFPGWLTPFSNTFGYGIAKLTGLTNTFDKILPPTIPEGDETAGLNKDAIELLTNVYQDKSLLINTFTTSNYEEQWDRIKSIFVPDTDDTNKKEFYTFVGLKDNVSEFIWFLLAGSLVTSVSYNSIVNNGCSQNVAEMKRRRAEYQDQLTQKKQDKIAAAKTNRPYYSTD